MKINIKEIIYYIVIVFLIILLIYALIKGV